jgi:hypothetical protein
VRLKLTVAGIALAVGCVVVYFRYVDKAAVCSLPAYWSMTGETPWGSAERYETGRVPVVLWRAVPGGYCYDSVFSDDLRKRSADVQATTVVVDYNVFSYFGKPRRHAVRAVGGMPVDRRSRQDSGMMEAPHSDRSMEPATDCEAQLLNNK